MSRKIKMEREWFGSEGRGMMTAARRLSMQPDNLRRLLADRTNSEKGEEREEVLLNGPAIMFKNIRRKQRDGACSAGSGHVQFLDTTAVESLYGERHESEPQPGLKIGAWDAPTNINGPCGTRAPSMLRGL